MWISIDTWSIHSDKKGMEERLEPYMSMTVIFSFEFMSLTREADRFWMRFRMGPMTTNIQCGSVVVLLQLSSFSNASSRVASVRTKSFGVS